MNTIMQLLVDVGFKTSLTGTAYTAYAVQYVLDNEYFSNDMKFTKELYPMVAKKFGSSATRVERSMRKAIEDVCYNYGGNEESYFFKLYGSGLSIDSGKITNSEFIMRTAFILRNNKEVAERYAGTDNNSQEVEGHDCTDSPDAD